MKTLDLVKQYRHIFNTDYTQDANCEGAWLMNVDEDPITDSSTNGYDAALKAAGEPNYSASGKFGGCYDFDGDDYCDVEVQAVPATDEQLSVVTWINLDDIDSDYTFFGNRSTGINQGWQFAIKGATAGDDLQFTIFGVVDAFSDASGIVATTWTHTAVTYDKTNIRFYVDGVAKGAPAQSGEISASNQTDYIGALHDSTGAATNPVSGLLDEVAVFSRAIDSTEVNAIMDNGLKGAVAGVNRRTRTLMGVGR